MAMGFDSTRDELIYKIIDLDLDTYQGIDDPSFLQEMTTAELEKYLAKMEADLT